MVKFNPNKAESCIRHRVQAFLYNTFYIALNFKGKIHPPNFLHTRLNLINVLYFVLGMLRFSIKALSLRCHVCVYVCACTYTPAVAFQVTPLDSTEGQHSFPLAQFGRSLRPSR